MVKFPIDPKLENVLKFYVSEYLWYIIRCPRDAQFSFKQMWGEKMEGEIDRLAPNKYSPTEVTHIIRRLGLKGWTRCENKCLSRNNKSDCEMRDYDEFCFTRRFQRWVTLTKEYDDC